MLGRCKYFLFFPVLFFAFIVSCKPEPQLGSFQIEARVDTTDVTIGDIIHYRVLTKGGENPVRFPDWDESLSFEVRNKKRIGKQDGSKGVEFQIVFWDTGHFKIPPYAVQVLNADSTVDYSLNTDPIAITVYSTVTSAENSELKPIKAPVPVRRPLPWRVIVLGLVLFGLVFSLIYLWKQRLYPEEIVPPKWKVRLPPDKIALDRLRQLEQHGNGDLKEFYVRLSHILREYIENTLYIKTLEMTTAEIRSNQSLFDSINGGLIDTWLDLLDRADLVKYAKHLPPLKTGREDLAWSKQFVLTTAEQLKNSPDVSFRLNNS